jgi:hypothetical protein
MVLRTKHNLKVTVKATSTLQVHMEFCLHLQPRYKNFFHIEKHLRSLHTNLFQNSLYNVDINPTTESSQFVALHILNCIPVRLI